MVWGNYGECLRGKQQKLQNRAARVITGDSYEIRSIDILKKLNWKMLRERRKEQQLKYESKALRCQCPENNSDMFQLSDSGRYDLIRNNKFDVVETEGKFNETNL